MKKKTSLKNDKEAAEALVSKTANESDVDEEQQIADLSAVPTPKIGFKMPKLGAEEGGKKEGKDEGKKRPLTANLLNNQIVNMRKVVDKATFFLQGEMKKKLKYLEKKNEKKSNPKEQKRMEKMKEELEAMETLNRDEVVKYALVSKTPKNQLDFSTTKPVAERCLYHLATSKPVQKEVNKFRETYPDWETRTAYFLQRLGKQYQEAKASHLVKKPEKKTKSEKKSAEKEEKEEVVSDAEIDQEDISDPENEDVFGSESNEEEGEISDVEMGSSSEDEETIANRRNLLLGLCGIKEDKSRPKIAPKSKKRPAESEDEEENEGSAGVKADSSVKELLKKTIETQASKSKKDQRKLAAALREEKEKPAKRVVKNAKEATTSGSVVKRVKLSEGGLVDLQKPGAGLEEDSEDDEEEEEDESKPVSSFFLNPNSQGGSESSGEESVDDDKDFAAVPLRKKEPRELSKGRVKLQEKMERRGDDRRQKLQNQKKAIFEAKSNAKKPAPNPQNPETLHPSWAARVQKKQQLGQIQPQGKRVIFDEDD